MSESKIYVPPKPLTIKNALGIAVGSLLYACAVNWFMMPLNLYAGGVVGAAQLIRTLFFSSVSSFDVAGLVNFALNVPLFILAYTKMSKRLLIGTVISLVVQTIAYTVVPIPAAPLLDDTLACILLAGVIGGAGCGLVLIQGGSAGGLDLLGVYLSQRFPGFSVGIMNLAFNAILYSICAILFSLETAIYSILFVIGFSVAIDRIHFQNIEVELMIFTHNDTVAQMIMKKYVRGVTEWKGIGAYTKKDTNVLVTVVSKAEAENVRKDIRLLDSEAFIISHENTTVLGGYQKRLD